MDISSPLEIIASIVSILAALGTSFTLGKKYGEQRIKKSYITQRYMKVYAPLRQLLIDKHVTTAVAKLYPRRAQRIKRAKCSLKKLRFKEAYQRLWDKGITEPTSEIEYGGDFPLSEIRQIVDKSFQYTDRKLVNLIQRIERSNYEQYYDEDERPGFYNTLLSKEQIELMDHIYETFNKLNRKLIK